MWRWGTSYLFGKVAKSGMAAALFAFLLGIPIPAAATALRPHLTPVKEVGAPDGFSGVCARYAWACAQSGGENLSNGDLLALAEKINLAVNRSTREISDEAQYALPEYWALPTSRGGDCEDFALAKKQALVTRGVAPQRLLIATVLDRKSNPHAVLVVRTDTGDFVLDNLTDRVLDWRKTGYTFLRMQNPQAPNRWSAVLAGGVLGG